jgi:hypothetical protein
MGVAILVLKFIEVLIWPCMIVGVVLLFRKPLRSRVNNLTELEVGNLVRAKLHKKKIDAVLQETISEVNEILPARLSITEYKELENYFANQLHRINQPGVTSIEKIIPAKLPEENVGECTMLAVAVGISVEDNRRYRIYYDPANRTHATPFRYLGFYCDMTIFAVGEVELIAYCDLEDEQLTGTNGFRVELLDSDQRRRIIAAMKAAPVHDYDIHKGHKFFLLKDFADTDFSKSSNYALRSKRYFWLDEIEGFKAGMSTTELAHSLEGKTWE